MNRHFDLEGVENFRDFGGYDTACGRGVKRGLLFRSANYARATDADLAALQALGVSVVVDLRRADERTRDPSRRWTGFAAQVIDNDLGGEDADWARNFAEWGRSPQQVHEALSDFYRKAPTDPRHVDLFARYLRALAEAPGPVLVHCTAGKDRTGLACALTHHIAGVGRDDLLADYLLTNDEARIARRVEVMSGWIGAKSGRKVDQGALRLILSVDARYLDTAIEAMRAAHGSLDGYLEQALGVDADLREKIRTRILN
ncbi:tyrosine-protein phosphatase [Phenylobacterium sp.]|uniref:tyrosine-protein phosphatase n=1 Tax=Phenylobacterium sp. TaxID=1871053 RepID=UPI002F42F604